MKLNNAFKKSTVIASLIAMILLTAALPFYAGTGERKRARLKPAQLWQKTEKAGLSSRGQLPAVSEQIAVYKLNRTLLNDIFGQAPREFSDAAQNVRTILEVPTPDGGTARFAIQESPMLSAENQFLYPTWKQFSGQGIDDPTATARFDVNDLGFHGYVMGAGGTFLIDPYSLTDQKNYVVYYKGAFGGSRDAFNCSVKGTSDEQFRLLAPSAPAAFSNGTQLRTFRLAVSATKEYTNFFGGNVNTAFAAVTTTVNRMNTVYRRELATTFTLVSDTRTVYTNAADGGFPAANNPNVADLSLTRNQVVLDQTYGSANYDIGHALSQTPNPNGLAASPSLCDPAAKAQGFTGAPTPQGDGFDVDYVAHEIGHQFSMSHTFNNDIDGSCTTRSTDSAYEPASGITIMGYGGICAPRNLAANSIEFFNLRSFDQSLNYLQNTVPAQYPTCGTTTANGNTAPTVTSPGNFTIPRLTPFTLTATATDANGDALTYLWEEFDLNANGATGSVPNPNVPNPNNPNPTRNNTDVDSDENGTIRPIFRAYNATADRSRTFPSLNYILNPATNDPAGSNQPSLFYTGTLPNAPTSGSTNGYVCAPTETCVRGERLPTIARTMNFRVTVRDNRAGGGGVADALSAVTIAAGAGPFQVTVQNARPASGGEESNLAPAVTWQGGSQQTITWDPANTAAAPVNAQNVKISLSTDGGQTFPIVIFDSTPNDGSESVRIPNVATTQARIKIEAVGNIFFDINNANFTIDQVPTAATVSVRGRVLASGNKGVPRAVVKLTDQNGNVRLAMTNFSGSYSFSGVPAGQNYIFSVIARGYQFNPQMLNLNEDVTNLNFSAR